MNKKTATIIGLVAVLGVGLTWSVTYGMMTPYAAYSQPAQGWGTIGGYGARSGMMGGYGAPWGMMGASGLYSHYSASYYHNYSWGSGSWPVVHMVGYSFYPDSVTVAKGTTVTWVNMDWVQHTVTSGSETSPTGVFDSHELGHMQNFSYTFDSPGTYTYYCDLHPDMTGTVVVTG